MVGFSRTGLLLSAAAMLVAQTGPLGPPSVIRSAKSKDSGAPSRSQQRANRSRENKLHRVKGLRP